MSKQLNFLISPEKEKDLVDFIVTECDCKMLPYLESQSDVKSGDELSLHLYLLLPNCCDVKLEYEWGIDYDQKSKVVLKLIQDTPVPSLYPFVRYERDIFNETDIEEGCTPTRIYCDTSISQYPAELTSLFKKISRWIKKNSTKKSFSFIMPYYIVK